MAKVSTWSDNCRNLQRSQEPESESRFVPVVLLKDHEATSPTWHSRRHRGEAPRHFHRVHEIAFQAPFQGLERQRSNRVSLAQRSKRKTTNTALPRMTMSSHLRARRPRTASGAANQRIAGRLRHWTWMCDPASLIVSRNAGAPPHHRNSGLQRTGDHDDHGCPGEACVSDRRQDPSKCIRLQRRCNGPGSPSQVPVSFDREDAQKEQQVGE